MFLARETNCRVQVAMIEYPLRTMVLPEIGSLLFSVAFVSSGSGPVAG